MLNNENGFAYPLTLSIFIVFSLYIVIQTEQFLSEKRFQKETETILKQEYYMLCTFQKLEQGLQGGTIEPEGVFKYEEGESRYQMEPLTKEITQVTVKQYLYSGEEAIAFCFYDMKRQKMIKWVEKN